MSVDPRLIFHFVSSPDTAYSLALTQAERSRQSARECRARKKLRYQYLEEMVTDREKAVFELRRELEKLYSWALEVEAGRFPDGLQELLEELGAMKQE